MIRRELGGIEDIPVPGIPAPDILASHTAAFALAAQNFLREARLLRHLPEILRRQ